MEKRNSEIEYGDNAPEVENEIAGEDTSASESESVENNEEETESLKPISTTDSSPIAAKLKKFGLAAWAYIKHAKIELIVIAAIIVLDLITKALVAKFMQLGSSITLIPNFLYFTYALNEAAAFGGLFGLEKVLSPLALRIILLVITTIAIGVFCYLMYRFKDRHKLMRISLALILAGAIGNYIDRLFLGKVRDFIHFVYFGLDLPLIGSEFAIFNVADAALTVGVVIFVVYFIFFFKDPKPKKSAIFQNSEQVSDDAVETEESADSVESEAEVEPQTEPTEETDGVKADE